MRRLAALAVLTASLAAAAPALAGPDLPGGPRPGQSARCWLLETLGYEHVQDCDHANG